MFNSKQKKPYLHLRILALTLCLLLPILNVCSVNALSDETISLTLTFTHKNQNKYANCGGFDIFASDLKLMFYDETTGDLEKTHVVEYGTLTHYIQTVICEIPDDDTKIIVAISGLKSGEYIRFSAYYLTVANLDVEFIYEDTSTSEGGASTYEKMDSCLVTTASDAIYYIFCTMYAENTHTFIYRLDPTEAAIATLNDNYLFAPTVWIQDGEDSSNSAYFITRSASAGLRYNVHHIDLTDGTYTSVGTSGLDYSWGSDYVYFAASTYEEDYGNTFLVAYPDQATNKKMYVEVIRVNQTDIIDEADSYTWDSAVNIIRPISIFAYFNTSPEVLNDLNYWLVFTGDSYDIEAMQFYVEELDNDAFDVYLHPTYAQFDYGEDQYYNVASVGGYLDPASGVAIMYDYTNGKAIADFWGANNPSFEYEFLLNPSQIGQFGQYGIELLLGQQYYYSGYTYFAGVLSGNGTFTVSRTMLSTEDEDIADTGQYATITDGDITQGAFVFSIQPRFATETAYQGLKITIEFDTGTTVITHALEFYEDETAGQGSTVFGGSSGNPTAITDYLVGALLLLAPAIALGAIPGLGVGGAIVGLALGAGLGHIAGVFDLWILLFFFIALIVLLLFAIDKHRGG